MNLTIRGQTNRILERESFAIGGINSEFCQVVRFFVGCANVSLVVLSFVCRARHIGLGNIGTSSIWTVRCIFAFVGCVIVAKAVSTNRSRGNCC